VASLFWSATHTNSTMRGQSNKVQPVLRAAVVLSMREKGQLTELMPYNFYISVVYVLDLGYLLHYAHFRSLQIVNFVVHMHLNGSALL